MAQPPDQMPAAAGRDHLRASHADREHAIEMLKAAYVHGMLTKDEFDLRVSQAFASRIHADLDALSVDLPGGLVAAKPPQPAQAQDGLPVLHPGRWIAVSTATYAGIWSYLMFLSPNGGDNPSFPPLVVGGGIGYLFALLVSVWFIVESRREKRSGGQSPGSAPGAGGQAPRRLPSADQGGQLPPADPGHQHTAEAAPSRRPRPPLPVWRARISMFCVR